MNQLAHVDAVRAELKALADPQSAVFLQRFFQTGPGQYGEGDRFLGIRVPALRALSRRCRELSLDGILELLRSPWHEERHLALLTLVDHHRRGGSAERAAIHRAYLDSTAYINNWDLVDSTAEHIVGVFVDPANPTLLEELAHSSSLWERRIAMLATFYWIRRGDPRPALRIAGLLIDDDHDLIHKATGWMLREVGKRDPTAEERFLQTHYREMPRTMLRYAIERLPADRRQAYLRGEV